MFLSHPGPTLPYPAPWQGRWKQGCHISYQHEYQGSLRSRAVGTWGGACGTSFLPDLHLPRRLQMFWGLIQGLKVSVIPPSPWDTCHKSCDHFSVPHVPPLGVEDGQARPGLGSETGLGLGSSPSFHSRQEKPLYLSSQVCSSAGWTLYSPYFTTLWHMCFENIKSPFHGMWALWPRPKGGRPS